VCDLGGSVDWGEGGVGVWGGVVWGGVGGGGGWCKGFASVVICMEAETSACVVQSMKLP